MSLPALSLAQPAVIKNGQSIYSSQLEPLLDQCFGADRKRKTAYKLREGQAQLEDLWFVAEKDGKLLASIQYWPIAIESPCLKTQALLLGPIAVHPDAQGKGLGRALIETSLAVASLKGHVHILLVGDADYYNRLGFSSRHTQGLSLPGPYDPKRLLHRQITPGSMLPFSGLLSPAFPVPTEGEGGQDEQQGKPGRNHLNLSYA
ncbi:MAG: N-acetyltransferase [Sphingomonadales bacterium]|jgi:predicted N-acetyltransferase YhbS